MTDEREPEIDGDRHEDGSPVEPDPVEEPNGDEEEDEVVEVSSTDPR